MTQPNWRFDPADKTIQEIREEFAARLKYFMDKKAWSQSVLSRQAGIHRDNISRYLKLEKMPNRESAEALSAALEIDLSLLIPGQTARAGSAPTEIPEGVNISTPSPDGMVRLKINQKVPAAVAYRIMAQLAETT